LGDSSYRFRSVKCSSTAVPLTAPACLVMPPVLLHSGVCGFFFFFFVGVLLCVVWGFWLFCVVVCFFRCVYGLPPASPPFPREPWASPLFWFHSSPPLLYVIAYQTWFGQLDSLFRGCSTHFCFLFFFSPVFPSDVL